MHPSNTPDARPTRAELATQLCDELIRLRDALVTLSIGLKDWQFEVAQNSDHASQQIASEVFERCRLQRPSRANPSEI
jgi:hypothetical protein